MNIIDIRNEIDIFLKQNQTTIKSFETFKKVIIKKVSSDKLLALETNLLFAMVGSFFKGDQFVGKNDINVLSPINNNNKSKVKRKKNISNPINLASKTNNLKSTNIIDKKKTYLSYDSTTKSTKIKIPKSKNKLTVEESEILILERKFVKKDFNVKQLAESMQWNMYSLVDVLKQIDSDINLLSKLKKEHLLLIKDQLYVRMLEIEQESIRNKVEGPKFKPNYYKLIYNAVGTKK